jgi:hypothetical protein
MAKKQKKEEDIPRPKEDVKRETGSFKNAFADFIKKTSSKPKEKPSD